MVCEKNVIKVITPYNEGTGVLLKCKYVDSEYNRNYYMVITNAHIINEEILTKEYRNLKLVFYDDYSQIIELDKTNGYIIEDVFVSQNEKYDIASILISICGNHPISIIENICYDRIDNDRDLLIIGYPGILSEDNVSCRIRLNCKEYELFPSIEDKGSYIISNDIHYYDDMNDKDVLSGLSGSPVFVNDDNMYSLIGISASIPVVNYGKNPFKQVYYLRIKNILQYLYDKGIIIFSRNDKYKFLLKWVRIKKNNNVENENYNKKLTMILVGSSGSGKSSITRELTRNKQYLLSVGDGQTTRNNVYYHYYSNLNDINKINKISITLLDKNEFIRNMFARIEGEKLLSIYKIFTESKKEINNNESFLLQFYKDLNDKQYKSKNENDINASDIVFNYLCGNMQYDNKGTITIFDIYRYAYEFYCDNDFSGIENISNDKAIEIFEELTSLAGFFNISEFEEVYSVRFVDKIRADIERFVKNINDKHSESTKNLTFYRLMNNYYEYIYDILNKETEQYIKNLSSKYGILYNEKTKTIDINLTGSLERTVQDFISYCLKVIDNKSITAMVKEVHWYDIVSYKYANALDSLSINELLVVDTCGLDHISSMNDYYIKMYLTDLYFSVLNLIDDFTNTGIVYIKKMDSGKPDEIRRVLPIINDALSGAQLYFMLNGSDIKYKDGINKNISDEDFNTELQKLKIYNQLNDILEKMYKYDDNFKIVIRNNIGLFCANDSALNDNYLFDICNNKSIKKILSSIKMQEKNSLDIINYDAESILDNIETNHKDMNIDNFVIEFFEASSANGRYTMWQQWNIMQANNRRLNKKDSLGYYNAYNDYWYYHFNSGYSKTLEYYKKQSNVQIELKIYLQVLNNMKSKLLGKDDLLKNVDYNRTNNQNGIEFRELIEEMYNNNNNIANKIEIFDNPEFQNSHKIISYLKEESLYFFSPFINHYNININDTYSEVTIGKHRFTSQQLFDNLFNFSIGINKVEMKNKFIDLLKKIFKKQFDEDKKEKVVNFMLLNEGFLEQQKELENKFMHKYFSKEGKISKEVFYKFMKEYYEYRTN